jgi:ribosome-binding factor A
VHRLDLRKVPFLNFRLDTSIAEGAAVLAHIEEARREDDARAGD